MLCDRPPPPRPARMFPLLATESCMKNKVSELDAHLCAVQAPPSPPPPPPRVPIPPPPPPWSGLPRIAFPGRAPDASRHFHLLCPIEWFPKSLLTVVGPHCLLDA